MSVGALDLATSASRAGVTRSHLDKENIADFIAKKREIFLVQVSDVLVFEGAVF
jgi:hypothetical protein